MSLPVTSNLVLWLAADAITGTADGTALSSWADASGLSNSATQLTVSRQPVYKTNVTNGLPGVLFSSASGVGMTTPLALSPPYTLFVVYNSADINTSRRAIQDSSNNLLLGPRRENNTFTFYDGSFIPGTPFVANQFQCSTIIVSSSSSSFYINGETQGSNGNRPTFRGVSLASGGVYNEPLNGYICEIVAYNVALQSSEFFQVQSYINNKYALSPENVGPQTGVNVSKANVYAVLEKPLALNVSKALVYTVLEKPLALNVSKANVYAVLTPMNSNPPVWPNFTFADGVVGNTYSQQWDLTPAAAPTTYTLYSGTLPTGLTISNVGADIGTLSGTPTTAGTYTFQILATNSVSAVPSGTFSMNISAASSGGQVAHAFIGL